MKFVQLISLRYLLLLAFGLLVFRYGFLDLQPGLPLALNHWRYALMVLAALLVAAGGFFIINCYAEDYRMPEGKMYNIYVALTLPGLAIGYYLADFLDHFNVVMLLVMIAVLMYIYATGLRKMLLVSNFIAATVTASSLVLIAIYNLYPVLLPSNKAYLATIFGLMLDYTLFIFVIIFILTLVYNLKNINSDYNDGNTTLPIVLGRDRAVKVTFVIALLPLAFLVYYANKYLLNLIWSIGYGLLFIVAPLIYFLVKLWGAKSPNEFRHLAFILKMVVFFTIISIIVITYNIQYNA